MPVLKITNGKQYGVNPPVGRDKPPLLFLVVSNAEISDFEGLQVSDLTIDDMPIHGMTKVLNVQKVANCVRITLGG